MESSSKTNNQQSLVKSQEGQKYCNTQPTTNNPFIGQAARPLNTENAYSEFFPYRPAPKQNTQLVIPKKETSQERIADLCQPEALSPGSYFEAATKQEKGQYDLELQSPHMMIKSDEETHLKPQNFITTSSQYKAMPGQAPQFSTNKEDPSNINNQNLNQFAMDAMNGMNGMDAIQQPVLSKSISHEVESNFDIIGPKPQKQNKPQSNFNQRLSLSTNQTWNSGISFFRDQLQNLQYKATAQLASTDQLFMTIKANDRGQIISNPRIVILDQKYPQTSKNYAELIKEIKTKVRSICWFSYRKGLDVPLPNSSLRSDAGWGCVIRTTQMMFMEAIKRHFDEQLIHALFVDNELAPFGIHQLCKQGLTLGKQPGEWYGPSSMMRTFHQVNKNNKPIPNFKICLFDDGTIFLDKIQKKLAKGNSVLIAIPMKLGLTSITQEYLECIKQVFQMESNCGVVGGQDHRSLWFVGMINAHVQQNPKLIYLDPHLVQEALLNPTLSKEQLQTTSCQEVRTISLSKICTSVSFGFYVRDKQEFKLFEAKLKGIAMMKNSIFTVYTDQNEALKYSGSSGGKDNLQAATVKLNENDDDSDGFEMI